MSVWTLCSFAAAEPRYSIVDLGKSTEAACINNAGDVVGSRLVDGLHQRSQAFIYSHKQMRELVAAAGSNTVANGINTSGQIVGSFSEPQSHGFLYSNGSVQDLFPSGKPPEQCLISAKGINASGVIVGQGGGLGYYAVVYRQGKVERLGAFVERGYSVASCINSVGDIVGVAKGVGVGEEHGFLYTKGRMIDLGTLGGKFSSPNGINDSGQIVGQSRTSDGRIHAFLYTDGKMHDLGVPMPNRFDETRANAINGSGLIVGSASRSKGVGFLMIEMDSHAFVYERGQWVDLNSQVDLADTGFKYLFDATGINDSGQIIGLAMAVDSVHAYILTPIQDRKE